MKSRIEVELLGPEVGLPKGTLNRLSIILTAFPSVRKGWVFGSRAKGNAKPGSDLDLALDAPRITSKEESQMAERLLDLWLPVNADVAFLHQILNEDLLDHIKRRGIEIYSRSDAA